MEDSSGTRIELIDLFEKARALIPDVDHWYRGVFTRSPIKHCPITAIGEARILGSKSYALASRARNLFRHEIGSNWIAEWNDAPGRRFEEVEAAFNNVILTLQRDEGNEP